MADDQSPCLRLDRLNDIIDERIRIARENIKDCTEYVASPGKHLIRPDEVQDFKERLNGHEWIVGELEYLKRELAFYAREETD